MILITGATGHLGRSTIDSLLGKGIPASQISAIVRDPSKAEDLGEKGITVQSGNYHDYDSLLRAFKNVEKLLLISTSDMNDRSGQHINVVRAAKESGVKHIVYTSFQRKNEVSSPIQLVNQAHLDTEKEIKVSGMKYTILQNGMYADGLPMFLGEHVLESGIFLPAGNSKVNFTARIDIAEATANVITSSGHENMIYRVATSEATSFADIALMLGELTGKRIPYTDAPREAYIETLTKAGIPDQYIRVTAGFIEAIKQGEFDSDNHDLERLLYRKPVTLKEFLKAIYVQS